MRYGVQPAISALDDGSHVRARQALVRRMRVVVPAIIVPTVLVAAVVLVAAGSGTGFGFRISGIVVLAAFVLLSALGTVPINIQVNDWDPDHPPDDWKATVIRWQRIDVLRSAAAIVAFGCFLAGVAAQLG